MGRVFLLSYDELDQARTDLLLVSQRLLAYSEGEPQPTADDAEFMDALDRMHGRLEARPTPARVAPSILPCARWERNRHAFPHANTVLDDGTEHRHELADIVRAEPALATKGLTLNESKQVLQHVQHTIINQQVAAYLEQQRVCPDCGKDRQLKRSATAPFPTLSDLVPVSNHGGFSATDKHTQARPFDQLQPSSRNVQVPIPNGPLTVGLDGGIVRARHGTTGAKTSNLFEVIAGKSILSFRRDYPEDVPLSSKYFALVQSVDMKSKRRLFALLQAQGMQANQQVTFFSDGGDTVRTLPDYLNPEAEHIVGWFHLTMRITVLLQYARELPLRPALPWWTRSG